MLQQNRPPKNNECQRMPIHQLAYRYAKHPLVKKTGLVSIIFLLLITTAVSPLFAQQTKKPKRPKYGELSKNIPTVKQLLTEEPVDWIVLKQITTSEKTTAQPNDDVIIVQTIKLRPAALEKIEARVNAAKKWTRPKTKKEQEKQFKKKQALYHLQFSVDTGENREKIIHRRHIREVIYHEDLLLRRIAILQDEENFSLAFELLFKLKQRSPKWPTIAHYEHRQLLTEGKQRFQNNRTIAALVMLEELHARNPKFPKLSELIGKVADRLITESVTANNFRRARHYIGRLQKREPKHPVFIKWNNQLSQKATVFLKTAQDAFQKKHYEIATKNIFEAVRIWPNSPGLRTAFSTITRRYQTLNVGIFQLPEEQQAHKKQNAEKDETNQLPSLAAVRQKYLTQASLFEAKGFNGTPQRGEKIHYQTRYINNWEPTDLGRRTIFVLQKKRPYSQSYPAVTASEIASTLRAKISLKSPHYNERLASYIQSFTVLSPTKLEIRFSRAPARLESLLNFPLIRPAKNRGNKTNTTITSVNSTHSPRFVPYRPSQWTDQKQTYNRNLKEPENAPENRYHVARIVEHKFYSRDKAIQALKRGQIQLLANVRPQDVRQLKQDSKIAVRQYAFPKTHLLQFNPQSELLQTRELRRALQLALNRKQILNQIVLRSQTGQSVSEYGRIISGPFPANSYATSISVKPAEQNLILALALKIVVNRQLMQAHYTALGAPMALIMARTTELEISKQQERAHYAAFGSALALPISSLAGLGGWIPTLKMRIPKGKLARQIAEKCVQSWGRIGLQVEIIDPADQEKMANTKWDIVYRTIKMVDPVVDLWPFLALEKQARVNSLKHFPDWLRQELIQLDTARDWSLATNQLQKLHEHLAQQTHLIPLFEVDDFFAIRKNVSTFRNPQLRPIHTYQDIDQWIINPEYPANTP